MCTRCLIFISVNLFFFIPDLIAAEQEGIQTKGFFSVAFSNPISSVVWILLFLTSFAMVGIIIHSAIMTRRKRLLPNNLINEVRKSINEGDLDTAIDVCENTPGPMANILTTGFSNISEGFEAVQEAVSSAIELESERIMQRIRYLNLCGQIAPLLGLLGTVTGMVTAFRGLAQTTGAEKTRLLAESISNALWTTTMGLLIAVPALLAFALLKNYATQLLLQSEAIVIDFIKILRGAEIEETEDMIKGEEGGG